MPQVRVCTCTTSKIEAPTDVRDWEKVGELCCLGKRFISLIKSDLPATEGAPQILVEDACSHETIKNLGIMPPGAPQTKRVTTDTGGEFIFSGATTLTTAVFKHLPKVNRAYF
jgi:hypothetical protein